MLYLLLIIKFVDLLSKKSFADSIYSFTINKADSIINYLIIKWIISKLLFFQFLY